MPVRGKRNPALRPKTKLTNSGMFSKSGVGQKLDPPIKTDAAVKRAWNEAYKNTTYKPGG